MKEILKPRDKDPWLFKPQKGKLLFQDWYKYDSKSESDILSGRNLIFFMEIGKPGFSWQTCSLGETIIDKSFEDTFCSGFLKVKPKIMNYYERNTRSSIMAEENISLPIYSEVDDIGLNGLLYGMAKYLKNTVFNGNEAAKQEMANWYLQFRDFEEVLPEEKSRVFEIYHRIMKSWDNPGLWKQINNLRRQDISEL